ncbi:hypothetical protein ABPG77_002681 [Micractinium sp. CCAP 211/92]
MFTQVVFRLTLCTHTHTSWLIAISCLAVGPAFMHFHLLSIHQLSSAHSPCAQQLIPLAVLTTFANPTPPSTPSPASPSHQSKHTFLAHLRLAVLICALPVLATLQVC